MSFCHISNLCWGRLQVEKAYYNKLPWHQLFHNISSLLRAHLSPRWAALPPEQEEDTLFQTLSVSDSVVSDLVGLMHSSLSTADCRLSKGTPLNSNVHIHTGMHAHMLYAHIQCPYAAYMCSLSLNHWDQRLKLIGTWKPLISTFLGGKPMIIQQTCFLLSAFPLFFFHSTCISQERLGYAAVTSSPKTQ